MSLLFGKFVMRLDCLTAISNIQYEECLVRTPTLLRIVPIEVLASLHYLGCKKPTGARNMALPLGLRYK
jgi:hypothetical protein